MNHEEFKQKLSAIPDKELVEMVEKTLTELCKTGGRSFVMCVPPKLTDTDIIISEVINRFKKVLNPDTVIVLNGDIDEKFVAQIKEAFMKDNGTTLFLSYEQ
jgi:hypothetical protein